jgi:circadian clock protein KaiB
MKKASTGAKQAAAETQSKPEFEHYQLRLFVTGATPRSLRAIESIKQLCESRLNGRYELEVVDLYQQPALAKQEQIVAAPTLIKLLPLPLRRLIGDLSDNERILAGLELIPQGKADASTNDG